MCGLFDRIETTQCTPEPGDREDCNHDQDEVEVPHHRNLVEIDLERRLALLVPLGDGDEDQQPATPNRQGGRSHDLADERLTVVRQGVPFQGVEVRVCPGTTMWIL